jgi:chemotaxis protein CheD
VVKVGVAQFCVGRSPDTMMTMALGSCLGIVLFDAHSRVGALAHAMHPRHERVKNNANKAKFVDTVVPLLIEGMVKSGARRNGIVAKLFGGARMFESYAGCRGLIQIGDENVAAAREALKVHGIPIVAECVGGSNGRTIVFDVSTGKVIVRDVRNFEEIV